jgi:hypothetical protein
MNPVRARVRGGRLTLDEPTDLPEGTEVELIAADQDDLTDDDRAALHRALELSMQQAKAGSVRPASEIVDEIRRRT